MVESRNSRITDLGKDKVHILTKIKEPCFIASVSSENGTFLATKMKRPHPEGISDFGCVLQEFRKSLSLLDWEHEMLALQTTDLEAVGILSMDH